MKRVAARVRGVIGGGEELVDLPTELHDVVLAHPPQLLGVPDQVVGRARDVAGGCAGGVPCVVRGARVLRRSQRMLGVPEEEAVAVPVGKRDSQRGARVEVVADGEQSEAIVLVLRLVRVGGEERRGVVPILIGIPSPVR